MADHRQDLLEEPQALPSPEDALDEGEEPDETPRLSIRQKVITGVAVVVSFLLFSIVFLPMEPVVRYFLRKGARVVRIEFKSLELNLFSADVVTDLRVTTPDGSFLRGTSVLSTLSYFDLLSEQARGRVRIPRLDIEAAGLEAKINGVDLEVNLRKLFQPPSRWEGLLSLNTASIQISSLPPALRSLGIEIDPSTIKIRKLRLKARMESGGRMDLNGTSVSSNLFEIRVKGSGRVRDSIVSPDLDATICFTPDRALETTNKALLDMYIVVGGTAAGSLCPRVKGIPGNLRWEMPAGAKAAGGDGGGGTVPSAGP